MFTFDKRQGMLFVEPSGHFTICHCFFLNSFGHSTPYQFWVFLQIEFIITLSNNTLCDCTFFGSSRVVFERCTACHLICNFKKELKWRVNSYRWFWHNDELKGWNATSLPEVTILGCSFVLDGCFLPSLKLLSLECAASILFYCKVNWCS